MRHFGVTTAYVAKCIPSDDVDDIVQDIFLDVVRVAEALRNSSCISFCSFVVTVTRRQVASYYRRRRHEAISPIGIIGKVENPDLITGLEASDIGADAEALLGTLPHRQRMIVQLHIVEQLSLDEVAVLTGLSRNAVSCLCHRAVDALRQDWRGAGHYPNRRA
jgi:RNA polymerase sigma-70 factor, ECF subfamily